MHLCYNTPKLLIVHINKNFSHQEDYKMKVKILSSKNYETPNYNHGDCFIIDTGSRLVIYDCGSEEHAKHVIDYMDKNNYQKATFILSHNDSDHVNGLYCLIAQNRIDAILTTLLLKYKTQLLDILDDGRRTRESVGNRITELYDNIAKLTGQKLVDIYQLEEDSLPPGLTFIGPKLNDMLEAVAKNINNQEGDTIAGETIYNATSLQIAVNLGTKKMLLCGDASYDMIKGNLRSYDYIQLPHHGKVAHAKKIFQECGPDDTHITYIVSDNTGTSNGGSDDLSAISKGHYIKNTKYEDILPIKSSTYNHCNGLAATPLGFYGNL